MSIKEYADTFLEKVFEGNTYDAGDEVDTIMAIDINREYQEEMSGDSTLDTLVVTARKGVRWQLIAQDLAFRLKAVKRSLDG